jgi:hypothetical protein
MSQVVELTDDDYANVLLAASAHAQAQIATLLAGGPDTEDYQAPSWAEGYMATTSSAPQSAIDLAKAHGEKSRKNIQARETSTRGTVEKYKKNQITENQAELELIDANTKTKMEFNTDSDNFTTNLIAEIRKPGVKPEQKQSITQLGVNILKELKSTWKTIYEAVIGFLKKVIDEIAHFFKGIVDDLERFFSRLF